MPAHRDASVAQAACLADCFKGLFSSWSSPAPPQRQGYVPIPSAAVVLVERIKEDSINSQDNVASKAYALDAVGNYFFGNISGCTIVYARGSTCATAAHFFGTTCREDLATALKDNIEKKGDTLSLVKAFFSSEAEQLDHSKLTPSQATFIRRLGGYLGRGVTYQTYVYDTHEATILLKADGSFQLPGTAEKVTAAK
jgi:hypothetical protein